MRVLKWIFERCEGKDHAEPSPIGLIPKPGALDLTGSAVSADKLSPLFAIDPNTWLQEMQEIGHYLSRFGDRLPKEIVRQIDKQQERIQVSIHGG
jgi:phosphoenolpyruvate carboxykinase (GTP)